MLYAALFVVALLWGLEGEWLDTYDALLWILCFFAIEINVLEFEEEIPYRDVADAGTGAARASSDAAPASDEI